MMNYIVHADPHGDFYATGESAKEAKSKVWDSLTDAERACVKSIEVSGVEPEETELWGADEKCVHWIRPAHGGGIRCRRCGGWFCF